MLQFGMIQTMFRLTRYQAQLTACAALSQKQALVRVEGLYGVVNVECVAY